MVYLFDGSGMVPSSVAGFAQSFFNAAPTIFMLAAGDKTRGTGGGTGKAREIVPRTDNGSAVERQHRRQKMDRQSLKRLLLRHFPGCEDFLHATSARSQALMASRRAAAAKYAPWASLIHGTVNDPTSATIEVTERCNLNCVMCERRKGGMQNREMPLETYRRILDKVPTLQQVTLLGLGETLLHRDILEILKLNRSRGLTTTIVTNGFLLTPEIVDALLPGSRLCVSIDSPQPETYRDIRGEDLEKLLQRVRKVRDHRHKDIFWAINFVVLRTNRTQMAEMVSLARRLGIWVVNFVVGVGDLNPLDDLPAYRRNVAAARRRAFREGRFVTFSDGPGFMPCKCIEPWFLLRVALTGDLYPCCYIHGGERDSFCIDYKGQSLEVSQREYLMGNVLEAQDINTIWHGAKYRALRKRILERESCPNAAYDELIAAYRNAPQGFTHCDICMWRHGMHC
jgi:MoaA/NifB/PqqE/SkfB family radical SAM enzyme